MKLQVKAMKEVFQKEQQKQREELTSQCEIEAGEARNALRVRHLNELAKLSVLDEPLEVDGPMSYAADLVDYKMRIQKEQEDLRIRLQQEKERYEQEMQQQVKLAISAYERELELRQQQYEVEIGQGKKAIDRRASWTKLQQQRLHRPLPPFPRDALEGKGPQRRPQMRWDRRLEEVAKAVGGGCCRFQLPLKLAPAVRETVGTSPPPLPRHPCLSLFLSSSLLVPLRHSGVTSASSFLPFLRPHPRLSRQPPPPPASPSSPHPSIPSSLSWTRLSLQRLPRHPVPSPRMHE